MEAINIDGIIEKIELCVEKHKLSTGCYSRWLWGNRDLGRNEYGCADAANILYTVGNFPSNPEERAEWIRNLQEMQNPETGLFEEATHHTIHTTAHCFAALELFDAQPLYKPVALEKYLTKDGLVELLEKEVKWHINPWSESHKGAGIFACFINSDMADLKWKDWYFTWLWEHSSEEHGFFSFGDQCTIPLYQHMAAGFHYMFNHEYEHRPLHYPEKIIDSCLKLMEEPQNSGMIKCCTFIDVDVVYSLSRAMRQTPHRFYEGKAALELYAEKYIKFMQSIDYEKNEHFNDLHMLFGALCCLAELQSALPGKIITKKPLKLVLDRRPFI